jgi:hypothetical protein
LRIRFTVITDCQALVYLNKYKTKKPQIARWYEVLQEFDFEIKYRQGTRMSHVDALSRVLYDGAEPYKSVEKEIANRIEVFVAITKHEAVRLLQATDQNTRHLIDLLNEDHAPGVTNKEADGYQVTKGVLYKVHHGRPLLVVPKSMRKGVVIAAHDYGGHFSIDRTVARITADYWFAGMKRYVKQHIAMCVDCLTNKRPAGPKPGFLHPYHREDDPSKSYTWIISDRSRRQRQGTNIYSYWWIT